MLRYFLLFAALPLFAQDPNPKMILRGYGVPPASRCAGLFAVGWEYKDLNPGGLNYNCTRTGAQAYAWVPVGLGTSTWGSISGTLSSQVDLQNALNAKEAALTFSAPLVRSTNAISCPTCATLDGVQTLSNKTFVAPALGTPASGVATNLTGVAAALTAGLATALQNARTIAGVSFNGTANIDIPYSGLTGTPSLANYLTAGSTIGTDLPVLGNANDRTTKAGTRSGNTTEFATVSGAKTAGKQLAYDASGNVIATATDIGSGGGALSDFATVRTSSTVLSTAAGTGRHGATVYPFAASSATWSSGSASGMAYLYIDSSGVLTVGHNSANTLSCSVCVTATGVTDFPSGSIPIWTWPFTAGAWDATGGVDKRAYLSTKVVRQGTNILVVNNADGSDTVSVTGIPRVLGVAVGDPAGSTLATGVLGYIVAVAACTITGWDIVVDAGTATVDVWKIATGTAKPTVANTITASAKPAISTGTAKASTTLTGWTTSVAAGDILGFNLDIVATAKYITVDVRCQ